MTLVKHMGNFRFKELFSRFRKDRNGNFGIMTALSLMVLIPVGGIALDMGGMMNTQAKMRDTGDAAALAAASALAQKDITIKDAEKIIVNYLKANSPEGVDVSKGARIKITASGSGKNVKYRIRIESTYRYPLTPMTALMGSKTQEITAITETIATKEQVVLPTPLSMYMVLDQSWSMAEPTNEIVGRDSKGNPRYRNKLDALRIATRKLVLQFERADKDNKYIRAGAIAFSSVAKNPLPISWDLNPISNYVDNMHIDGVTVPVEALDIARANLVSKTETEAHKARNGGIPTKAILYLTDGRVFPREYEDDAQAMCTKAKKEKVEIYTIGFMMPPEGIAYLQDCASDAKHFFLANNLAELSAVFEKIGTKVTSDLSLRLTQ
ncbi:MAG: hypothetical protein RIR97_1063 [Pseudomonadota bacterium]